MTDLEITHSGEFMVAQVEGKTAAGIEFVSSWDAYIAVPMLAVDAGRIIIHEDDLRTLLVTAGDLDLSIDERRSP